MAVTRKARDLEGPRLRPLYTTSFELLGTEIRVVVADTAGPKVRPRGRVMTTLTEPADEVGCEFWRLKDTVTVVVVLVGVVPGV